MGFLRNSGWWFQPTLLKNMSEFVSWDDYSIPFLFLESHHPFHGSGHHQLDHHHILGAVGL